MNDLDSHKLHLHPGRVCNWLEGERTYPLTVEISPARGCNQRCSFCAFDYRRGPEMLSQDVLLNLAIGISKKAPVRTKSVHFGGEGEPTLNPHLKQAMDRMCHEMVRIGLTTNGTCPNTQFLMPFLSWIRFSINGATPETYSKIHGVHEDELEYVLSNLTSCVQAKKELHLKTTIGVQCLWLPENDSEIDVLAAKVRDIGVDYLSVKPYSWHPKSALRDYADFEPNVERMDRLLRKTQTDTFTPSIRLNAVACKQKPKDYQHCPAAAFFAFVAADGNVYPCAQFVGNDDYCMGNIKYQEWGEVVLSTRRRVVLDRLRYEHDVSTCRNPCRLDAANRYLNRLLNPEEHDAFL